MENLRKCRKGVAIDHRVLFNEWKWQKHSPYWVWYSLLQGFWQSIDSMILTDRLHYTRNNNALDHGYPSQLFWFPTDTYTVTIWSYLTKDCRFLRAFLQIKWTTDLYVFLYQTSIVNWRVHVSASVAFWSPLPGFTMRKFWPSTLRCPIPARINPVTVSFKMNFQDKKLI